MIVLYIILGVIAALLFAGLFIDKKMDCKREIVINKPKDEVFHFIKHLKNQDQYSKWATMDANMKNTYTGTDAQVGFISAWEGNKKVGVGEQEIIGISDNTLSTELRFVKPFKSVAKSDMVVAPVSDKATKVTWGFTSEMKYPMNIMKIFMNMEKMIGNDFSTGLANLKKVLEK
jgi:hypothetical protein